MALLTAPDALGHFRVYAGPKPLDRHSQGLVLPITLEKGTEFDHFGGQIEPRNVQAQIFHHRTGQPFDAKLD